MIKQVFAQVTKEVKNPISEISTFSDAFAIIMNIVLGIGISLTVIYLIFGGLQRLDHAVAVIILCREPQGARLDA